MKRLVSSLTIALATFVLTAVLDTRAIAHPGNVRASDCTHVDRRTGERHRHTGRPYCAEAFLSPAWMHH